MTVPGSLFAQLVDDAALFPPGNAPMDRALADHAAHREAWYGGIVGPFLCPASRIDELVATLPEGQRIRAALINDVTDDAALHARRVALTWTGLPWVESSYDRLGDDLLAMSGGRVPSEAPQAFLEVPRTDFGAALDLVGTPGWHAAKYRTGGATADAFPSELELAAFLVAATARDIPFKLTAGLHHAVRQTAEDTGFEQHGVLNVLVATRVAQQGSDLAEVAAVLAQRDPGPLVEFVQAWDDSTCTDVRHAFRSFGCCGVTDPIDDLAGLDLLAGPR